MKKLRRNSLSTTFSCIAASPQKDPQVSVLLWYQTLFEGAVLSHLLVISPAKLWLIIKLLIYTEDKNLNLF